MAVGELASLFAVIGGAGSFLIWLYKHLVQKPDQKIRKESTDRIIASEKANRVHLENTLQPLSFEIKMLNQYLDESMKDRENIHSKLDEHEEQLIDHDKRISHLEY